MVTSYNLVFEFQFGYTSYNKSLPSFNVGLQNLNIILFYTSVLHINIGGFIGYWYVIINKNIICSGFIILDVSTAILSTTILIVINKYIH